MAPCRGLRILQRQRGVRVRDADGGGLLRRLGRNRIRRCRQQRSKPASDDPPRLGPGIRWSADGATAQPSLARLAVAPSVATSGMPNSYRALVRRGGLRGAGIPPDLADAVAEVESGYHPGVGRWRGRGRADAGDALDRAYARLPGHQGRTRPARGQCPLRCRLLAQAWRLADQDICTATMKYRAGHGETRFFLSVGRLLRQGPRQACGPGLSGDRYQCRRSPSARATAWRSATSGWPVGRPRAVGRRART